MILRAERIRRELHLEPDRALRLLEAARGVASVEVDEVPVVALLAGLAHGVAAHGRRGRNHEIEELRVRGWCFDPGGAPDRAEEVGVRLDPNRRRGAVDAERR